MRGGRGAVHRSMRSFYFFVVLGTGGTGMQMAMGNGSAREGGGSAQYIYPSTHSH
jgi:hypothetical protein